MAGRIPQSFINDLIDRLDIVDVVERRMTLKKTGKNYSGLCPFHDEKTPSFSVAPDKGIYHCFGCGKGGNAVNFIIENENIHTLRFTLDTCYMHIFTNINLGVHLDSK